MSNYAGIDSVPDNSAREKATDIAQLALYAANSEGYVLTKVIGSRQEGVPVVLYINLEAKSGTDSNIYEAKFKKNGERYELQRINFVSTVDSSRSRAKQGYGPRR